MVGYMWNMMQNSSGWSNFFSQWGWMMTGPMIALFSLLFVGLWIYTSFAYMEIARKLKYKNPWLAWIPFARGAMILQLGGFQWGWIFLALIPVLGWLALAVLMIISHWRIYEKRKYPGWLALVPLLSFIPYLSYLLGIAQLVILGMVAWKDMRRRR